MSTFILTWNPDLRGVDGPGHQRDLSAVSRWGVGSRTGGIEPGDRGFLLRQHRDRGIVAAGEFTSTVFQGPRWDRTDRLANYAGVRWDTILPDGDVLPIEDLRRLVAPFPWDRLQGSGVRLGEHLRAALEQAWEAHLDGVAAK